MADSLALTACPEPGCDLPAEVVDTYVLDSTSGPVTHVATACLARHHRVHTID